MPVKGWRAGCAEVGEQRGRIARRYLSSSRRVEKWSVPGARPVQVNIFQPVLRGGFVKASIDPLVGMASLCHRAFDQKGRPGNQVRVDLLSLARPFPVEIES